MLSKTDCMKINSLYGCFKDPAVNRKIQIICAMVGIWFEFNDSGAICDIGRFNIWNFCQNPVNLNKSVPASSVYAKTSLKDPKWEKRSKNKTNSTDFPSWQTNLFGRT